MNKEQQKPGPGRPATGQAMSSTERAAKRDKELIEAGGRVLRNVRLSPEAAKALEALAAQHPSERSAIETALIEWHKLNVVSHDN
ncbi:hypothetical protein [Chromobacterium haemolyticum]|uniref:hypothetical protein n=1 Tax=Chromobacterium haemolyticum TaxID=394935 RepID=UPI002446AA83|nr:hypothetical protein [Chromobacterium haemolyticum]MDH0342113.1 hypothetical protein [Chromobacterium haemolyticum]